MAYLNLLVFDYIELYLINVLFLMVVRELKYRRCAWFEDPSLDDYWFSLAVTAVLCVPIASGHVVGSAFGASLAILLSWVLLLDSILFYLFTVELEFYSIKTYYSEIFTGLSGETSQVLRFLVRGSFSAFPLLVMATYVCFTFFRETTAYRYLTPLFIVATVIYRARGTLKFKIVGYGFSLAWLTCYLYRVLTVDGGRDPYLGPYLLSAAIAVLAVAKRSTSTADQATDFLSRPSFLRNFLETWPLADDADFEPRAEHVHLLEMTPELRRRGLLLRAVLPAVGGQEAGSGVSSKRWR